MKRLILVALIFVVACAAVPLGGGTAEGQPLPFTALSELKAVDKTLEQVACGSKAIMTVSFKYTDTNYQFFLDQNGSRWLLIRYNTQGEPQWVWFGDKGPTDVALKAIHSLSIEQAKLQFPNPCSWLVMKEA